MSFDPIANGWRKIMRNGGMGYEETTTVNGDTLTWDGNIDGMTPVNLLGDGVMFVALTDATPTYEDFASGYSITMNGSPFEFDNSSVVEMFDGFLTFADRAMYVVPSDNYVADGTISIEHKGIYIDASFLDMFGGLTINGYTGFTTTETVVHTIEPKYISGVLPCINMTSVYPATETNVAMTAEESAQFEAAAQSGMPVVANFTSEVYGGARVSVVLTFLAMGDAKMYMGSVGTLGLSFATAGDGNWMMND